MRRYFLNIKICQAYNAKPGFNCSNFRFVFYLLILCSTWFAACLSDKPDDGKAGIITGNGRSVLVLNEGNFHFGNAGLSIYSVDDSAVIKDIFTSVNQRPLGDVAQSMTYHNGFYYIVVNNSGKIEIINADNYKSIQTIGGLTSPRYMLPVSASKAYVSDLYQNAVSIVNLSNQTISGKINLDGWTEEMVYSYGRVFVTNQEKPYVYVIDVLTDHLIDSINTGSSNNAICEDALGKLWVVTNPEQDKKASLTVIDPITLKTEKKLNFTLATEKPWRLVMNQRKDSIYFLDVDVFGMSIYDENIPSELVISGTNHNFYGLGIEPFTGHIYVADAIDFVQLGSIYIYKSNGQLINTFKAGHIPGKFYFE